MASTKDAVNEFLQLGAKYELVLVGLYEDLQAVSKSLKSLESVVGPGGSHVNEAVQSVMAAQKSVSAMQNELMTMSARIDQLELKLRRQSIAVWASFFCAAAALSLLMIG